MKKTHPCSLTIRGPHNISKLLRNCVENPIINFSHFPPCHRPQRTWRKVWVLLVKSSSMRVGRLEFYTVFEVVDQKKVGLLKPPEKKVVLLNDCLSITPAPKESCPPGCTAFYLKTPQCNYTLASTASQEWQNALGRLAIQVSHISPLDQHYSPPLLFISGVSSFWKG